MMSIGISGLFVDPGRVGGAQSMLENLVNGIALNCESSNQLTLFTRDSWRPPLHPLVERVVVSQGARTNRFIQESAILPRIGKNLDAMIFPNYFTPPIVPADRVITVIHDLQYQHGAFAGNFSFRKRMWLRFAHELTLAKADAVVVLSESVKSDVIRYYGSRHASRLVTIPNPISWERFGAPQRSRPLDHPYILSVAAQYPHKNLETLVLAFALVRKYMPDVHLVLVGQTPSGLIGTARKASIAEAIRALELEDAVTVTGFVSDVELGNWYRSAEMFVFPSLFEGFGMPPVEALGLGTPTLTTRRSSIPEVTLNAANYVDDPVSADEFADFILEILRRPSGFAPSAEVVAEIRSRYAPEVVAKSYMDLLRTGTAAERGR